MAKPRAFFAILKTSVSSDISRAFPDTSQSYQLVRKASDGQEVKADSPHQQAPKTSDECGLNLANFQQNAVSPIRAINSLAPVPPNGLVDVIFCRFSSELQRNESNRDQERRCREWLRRLDIPDRDFIVLAEEAVSGASDNRPALDTLKKLIYSGRLRTLIVTEQSRLSRGDNIKALIKDIVYHGGRFIALTDGIDTNRRGWKTIVGISEIHHSRSNEDTVERVRGGQEGRIRDDNGSGGDFAFGYRSEFADPGAAAGYCGRGPKPKRIVVIDPVAAALVREIFRRFGELGESISAIVRWWKDHVNNYPSITRKPGAHVRIDHERRILMNEKYIGIWRWGATTTVYDGAGRKKAVPARSDQTVTVAQRPTLRIINDDLWAKVKVRLPR